LVFRNALAADPATIRVSFAAPVATLDPAKFRAGGLEYDYALAAGNRLTQQDAQLQVKPDLAASWESSSDLKGFNRIVPKGEASTISLLTAYVRRRCQTPLARGIQCHFRIDARCGHLE
jgi:hypothetical protein